MQIIQSIQNRIYEIRGERVMIDRDLAALYGVETKALNQAVRRNNKRFPPDFMFQLTIEEAGSVLDFEEINFSSRSQLVILKTKRGQNIKYLPYGFTEQGIAMLSSVLCSEKAINLNIAIMRAFIEIRKTLIQQSGINEQLKQIRTHLDDHDSQLNHIYDAMENLLDEKSAQKKWEGRQRIGFKT